MKKTLLTCLFAVGFSQPVWADVSECQMKSSKFSLTLFELKPADPYVMTQILDLQHDAEVLCAAGKVSESIALINKAYSLLGIEGN